MNNRTQCQRCGEDFYPDVSWKKICIPCFKITKSRENGTVSALTKLRIENIRLRSELERTTSGAIPADILNKLVRLAHPDRHGNSTAANDVTAWLLAQRGIASLSNHENF